MRASGNICGAMQPLAGARLAVGKFNQRPEKSKKCRSKNGNWTQLRSMDCGYTYSTSWLKIYEIFLK